MENQYGIVVSNKYALFYDDADPLDMLHQQEAKVKKKDTVKKEVDKSKANKANNKSTKKPVAPSPQESKSKAPEQSSQRRDVVESNRRESAPRGQNRGRGRSFRPNRETESKDSNEFGDNETERRPPRRRDDFSSDYRLLMSNQIYFYICSGVKAVEKKEGGGSHNWGTMKDDMEEQLKETETQEWSAQAEDAENQDPNETTAETTEANPEVPDEEQIVKQMTLDEWKALEKKNRVKTEFNIRKPNEGVDESQWKKTYVLKKKESDDEDEDEDEDEGYEDEPRRGKNILHNIKITFNDSPRRGRGGGRRGRGSGAERGGGERGTGGRGGGRAISRAEKKGGPRESAPCMDDENDFPRLVHTAA
ncbi:plasminogen activator inhibitor 1 RNA-binding protein [Octopus bimaculoides]|uniref:plasminogen activator inhibitor 1 RNA-binding protein n=1 Tax=Octopus bimaculoides TaxID=37653 RepID=UPI0022DF272A|nr:plasminogen activator inhibitor 1 RNA-binding protein [Octopus bimaculoides]